MDEEIPPSAAGAPEYHPSAWDAIVYVFFGQ